jgi:hypothetical protein
MFTEKECTYLIRVFSFLSYLPSSPFAFKRGHLVQDVTRYKKHLRIIRLGLVFLEFLTILLTLPSTMATKTILNIICHGSYVLFRAGFVLNEVNLIFHDKDVQELINQTFKMNVEFGARFLEGKGFTNKRREFLFSFMLFMCLTLAAISQMVGLFLTFWDLPFSVYPGSEALRGNLWLLFLMVGARGWFLFEEAASCTLSIIGIFSMNSNLFWLKKAW